MTEVKEQESDLFKSISIDSIKKRDKFKDVGVLGKDNMSSFSSNSNVNKESSNSHFTSMDGPPVVYEQVMQNLEADVRKHIRIEH